MNSIRQNFMALVVLTALPVGVGAADAPRVAMQTNLGKITLELNGDKAPKTVANFLEYVNAGFYSGTIFHRVIPGFMAQGGGYGPDFKEKATRAPIQNEANNGLMNDRGTVAMARTGDPHSATAQFFINVANNGFLNHTSPDPQGWGYAVFGKVVEGMDVVDKIEHIPTGAGGPFGQDVPKQVVTIEKMTIENTAKSAATTKTETKSQESSHEGKPKHESREHSH